MMMVGTPDGKYFMEYWSEENDFKSKRLKETNKDYVKNNCKFEDYVVFRPLTREELMTVGVEQ